MVRDHRLPKRRDDGPRFGGRQAPRPVPVPSRLRRETGFVEKFVALQHALLVPLSPVEREEQAHAAEQAGRERRPRLPGRV